MSKRKFFYDTIDDSNQRLRETVVVCKNEPAYVAGVMGLNTDQIAEVIFLPWDDKPKTEQIPLTNDFFEIKNLPCLGYVDFGNYSHYLCRRPSRQTKQGLFRNTVYIPPSPEGKTPGFNAILGTKEFYDMLKGKYPSLDKVFGEVLASDEPTKRAFSKTMAVAVDDVEAVSLWHRGMKVGVCNNPRQYGPVFKLPNKFSYLREELEENKIRIE